MSIEINLAGKNALLTGGGDGIGKATAKLLAEAGANIFIGDLNYENAQNTVKEIRDGYNVQAFCSQCDLASTKEVNDLVDKAVKKMGSIDILNNIAGVSTKVDFLNITEDEYNLMMDVNAKGTFFIDQAVLKIMIPNKKGKIVNMSSMSGKEGYPTNVAYSASKFAVTGITQAVAKYAAPYNINVNAVCPGIVRTQIWEGLLEQTKEQGEDPDAYWQERISAIPLQRPQTPIDIARMFVYLSSDYANNMTGQAINITGGLILH